MFRYVLHGIKADRSIPATYPPCLPHKIQLLVIPQFSGLTQLILRYRSTATGDCVALALNLVQPQSCRVTAIDNHSAEFQTVIQFQDNWFLLFFGILIVHSLSLLVMFIGHRAHHYRESYC